MMATVLLQMLLLYSLASWIISRARLTSRILGLFEKYSFGAYLIHDFVLKLVNHSLIGYVAVLGVYAQTLISFVLCSVISLLFCMGQSRMMGSVGEVLVGKV